MYFGAFMVMCDRCLQIDVDVGSSSVARSVCGLVLNYATSVVIDFAMLIEVCPSF